MTDENDQSVLQVSELYALINRRLYNLSNH